MGNKKSIGIAFPGQRQAIVADTIDDMMGVLLSSRWPSKVNDTTWQHAFATCIRALLG